MSKFVEERANISQTVGQNHRKNYSASSTVQASTILENSSIVPGPSGLRVYDPDHTRMQSRIAVVDTISSTVEWTVSEKTQWKLKDFGLQYRRTKATHQCSGDQSCDVRCGRHVPGKCTSSSGQCHDKVLHQQDGRDQIYGRDKHLESPLELMFQQTDRTHNGVPPRDSESDSRCPVSELPRFKQLETEQIHFPGNNQNPGSSGDQSVHRQNQYSGAQVHQQETRSEVLGNRCFHGLMVWRCGICFPTILSNTVQWQW